MGRLIDADKLKRKCQKTATEAWKMKIKASIETTLNQFIDWIDQAEPVDAVPVVHGRWIPCHPLGDDAPEGYMCSVCHVGGWEKTNFCPMCGADMRKDGDYGKAD